MVSNLEKKTTSVPSNYSITLVCYKKCDYFSVGIIINLVPTRMFESFIYLSIPAFLVLYTKIILLKFVVAANNSYKNTESWEQFADL